MPTVSATPVAQGDTYIMIHCGTMTVLVGTFPTEDNDNRQQERCPGAPPPDNAISVSVPRPPDMMALKHHHHNLIVVATATTDEDDAHKLLYLEAFSCFRVMTESSTGGL